MKLYEQFKEDIKEALENCDNCKSLNKDYLCREHNDIYEHIKQSYINAIDVMIENNRELDSRHRNNLSIDATDLLYIERLDLKEQRKLINDYE